MEYKNRILNLVAVMSKEFVVIYLRADTKWGNGITLVAVHREMQVE
jgi:hypothetical protein